MPTPDHPVLSKREQQIMDCIYARGKATADEVQRCIADAPSYSSIRALLRILVDKGHVRYEKEGPRYVYYPTRSRRTAGGQALKRVVNTFFEGSIEKTVAALIDVSGNPLSPEHLEKLQALIDQARKQGRRGK
jgi:predicted transcriptional regulator